MVKWAPRLQRLCVSVGWIEVEHCECIVLRIQTTRLLVQESTADPTHGSAGSKLLL
ncbi:uncharacterized protein [Physcomitrium patens]|uniref:uncharacterized protein isoform X2 n=1 Tax=Physcomitrium patens TaxID=3218 RepID=UPI003CCD281B